MEVYVTLFRRECSMEATKAVAMDSIVRHVFPHRSHTLFRCLCATMPRGTIRAFCGASLSTPCLWLAAFLPVPWQIRLWNLEFGNACRRSHPDVMDLWTCGSCANGIHLCRSVRKWQLGPKTSFRSDSEAWPWPSSMPGHETTSS